MLPALLSLAPHHHRRHHLTVLNPGRLEQPRQRRHTLGQIPPQIQRVVLSDRKPVEAGPMLAANFTHMCEAGGRHIVGSGEADKVLAVLLANQPGEVVEGFRARA